jgi:hypothetical protein
MGHAHNNIMKCDTLKVHFQWVIAKIGLNSLDPDKDQNKHRIKLE